MRGVQNENMFPLIGKLLDIIDKLREIRVGEISDDHPQHLRRAAFQGPGNQIWMVSELLRCLPDPELSSLRHFLRAAVEDVTHRGGRHSRQSGHIASSDPGGPAFVRIGVRHNSPFPPKRNTHLNL